MTTRPDDIPFTSDPSTRFMPWIAGLMVFVAALALCGALLLSDFARQWQEGLAGKLTIQIPPAAGHQDGVDAAQTEETGKDGGVAAAQIDAVVRAALRTQGVRAARPLSAARVSDLLEPWLGELIEPGDLPLPVLVSVELAPGESFDRDGLRRRLADVAPQAGIDDHGLWRTRMSGLARSLQAVALVVVVVIAAAAATLIVFATRGSLLAHRETIRNLHLVGAEDAYIARLFQRQALRAGLRGGAAGTAAAALTTLALGWIAGDHGDGSGNPLVLRALDWLWLLAAPPTTAVIATLAARRTVMNALRRML